MDLFPQTFDVVFCLGVLYHTPDPVGMLRKINSSLKSKGEIVFLLDGDDQYKMNKTNPHEYIIQ